MHCFRKLPTFICTTPQSHHNMKSGFNPTTVFTVILKNPMRTLQMELIHIPEMALNTQ